jgi:YfiH family protein
MAQGDGTGFRGGRMIRAIPDAVGIVQLDLLSGLPHVRHGFETRTGRLADVVPTPIARLHQVHGADVLLLPDGNGALEPFLRPLAADRPEADALITDRPGATVAVAVADCLPMLLADRNGRAVAAVHGGWRGLAGGVLESAIAALGEAFGTEPEDLVLGIGPAIGPCCFEVGPEVIEAFDARGYGAPAAVVEIPGARPHVNLEAVARHVALDNGVPAGSIATAGLCTKCNADWLWSYRAAGDSAGRLICGIALGER